MREEGTTTDPAAVTGWTVDVLLELAGFLKASFVYPDVNLRVSQTCAAARAAVGCSPQDRVAVRIAGAGMCVAGEPVVTDHPLGRWLYETFLHAGLGGVELHREVTEESLGRFARTLCRCYAGGAGSFASLWEHRLDDLWPVELEVERIDRGEAAETAPDPADPAAVEAESVAAAAGEPAASVEAPGPAGSGADPATEPEGEPRLLPEAAEPGFPPEAESGAQPVPAAPATSAPVPADDGPGSASPGATTEDDGAAVVEDVALELLDSQADLAKCLDQLNVLLVAEMGNVDPGELTLIDTLDAILSVLPRDERTEPRRVRAFLDDLLALDSDLALESLRSLFERGVESALMNGGADLGLIASAPKGEPPVELRPDGRAEDVAILDDVDAMLEELEELPARGNPALHKSREHGQAELFDVCMHLLVSVNEPKVLARTRIQIDRILDTHPEYDRRMVPYLEASLAAPEQHRRKHLWRIVAIAYERKMHRVLGTGAYLTPAVVSRTFPKLFFTFLDLINPANESARQRLDATLTAIGRRRMSRKARDLVHGGELLVGSRLRTALSTGHETMVPTIEFLARKSEHSVRKLVVEYLLMRAPDAPESVPLRVIQPLSTLSSEYLKDLAELTDNPLEQDRLRSQASRVLRGFIRSSAEQESLAECRIEAVQQLASLPSQENLALLRELRKGGFRAVLSAPQREMRRVAHQSYVEMRGKLGG